MFSSQERQFLKAIIAWALAKMIMELLEVRLPGRNLECYLGSGVRVALYIVSYSSYEQ